MTDITAGDKNELHLVHLIYKTLDSDGATRLHVWSGEVASVDAAQALRFTLGTMLSELPTDEPAPVQIYEIVEASVTLVDDTLRQKLEALATDD